MNSPEKKAEWQKMLHLLNIKDSVLPDALHKLTTDELRALRIKVIEFAQMEQSDTWKKLAAVVKYIPNYINAKLAEFTLGPLITANMSYYIDPKDAVAIMKNLSLPFMTQVSENMIPEKSEKLINSVPLDMMKKVVMNLVKSKKHHIVGGFVDVTERGRVLELAKYIDKEEDIIQISGFAQNKSYLADILEHFNDDKVLKLIETAYLSGQITAIIQILEVMDLAQMKRFKKITIKLPQTAKEAFIKEIKLHVKQSDRNGWLSELEQLLIN